MRAASAAIRRIVTTAKNIIKYSIGISVLVEPVEKVTNNYRIFFLN